MERRFEDIDALYRRLLGHVNVERGQKTVFKLDRMRRVCSALGDPESFCPVFHIAGSKGKGSVSIMIARVLEAGGFRTGLYTSPHFMSWKERISLAGDELPDEVLIDAAEEVFSCLDDPGLRNEAEEITFFELTTLIAFCAFRLALCDRVVLETGLGGRLDSTNVVDPRASVITRIELEHTEYLGDTIEAIAAEKAGIIKPGRPCYIGKQRPEARRVFELAARNQASPLRDIDELSSITDVEVSREGTRAVLDFGNNQILAAKFPSAFRVRTPLIGSVQAQNMALALCAVAENEGSIDESAAVQGLGRAFLPARFQVLPVKPPIVLDGAHTPDSISLTLETFNSLFPGPKALLFGCAEDKKHALMAGILAPAFDRITLTRPGSFKQSDLASIESSFRAAGAAFRVEEDFHRAVGDAISEAIDLGMPLLVTGSFYLCAEVYKTLNVS
jgi:dihydrofolate synthase/folylpolyglutamate synthase